MIPRYSRPQMAAIWAPENRYRIWFEIEALAAEGMARAGLIPEEAARTIREKGTPKLAAMNASDIERIDAIPPYRPVPCAPYDSGRTCALRGQPHRCHQPVISKA